MRDYEIVWVIAPTETDDGVQALIKQYEELLTSQGAKITSTEVWGRRKLAYEIKRYNEGIYVSFDATAEAEAISELERRFRMSDQVLRYLTIRMDEEIKRARQQQAERAKRRQAELESAAQENATGESTPSTSLRPTPESPSEAESTDEAAKAEPVEKAAATEEPKAETAVATPTEETPVVEAEAAQPDEGEQA